MEVQVLVDTQGFLLTCHVGVANLNDKTVFQTLLDKFKNGGVRGRGLKPPPTRFDAIYSIPALKQPKFQDSTGSSIHNLEYALKIIWIQKLSFLIHSINTRIITTWKKCAKKLSPSKL
jgi:hypothetical protein